MLIQALSNLSRKLFNWILLHGNYDVLKFLSDYFQDIITTFIALIGIAVSLAPRRVAAIENDRKKFKIAAAVIGCLLSLNLYLNIKDKQEFKRQVSSLVSATTSQASSHDIETMNSNLARLRIEMNNGFNRTMEALTKTISVGPKDLKASKPPIKKIEPAPTLSLGPSLVHRLQVTERRAPSTRPDAPFAVQIILQTKEVIQPAAFLINFNEDIEEGKFFIAGQSVLMGVTYGVQANKKSFYFRFQYPPFTPESPIILTIMSKRDIRAVNISQIP